MAGDFNPFDHIEIAAASDFNPFDVVAPVKAPTKAPGALPKKKDPNASWVGTNLAKGWETGREVVGGLQRFAGDEEGGQSTIAKSKDRMAQLEADIPSMESKDVSGVGTGLKFVGEQILKNAALAAPSIAAGVGTVLAAPVVGTGALATGALAAAGAFAPSLAIETGIVSADSDKIEGNRGRILKGAVPAAALDAASTAVTMGAGGLTKMLRKPVKDAAVDLLAPTVKKSLASRTVKAAAGLGAAGLEEGATEGAQSPLEKWGAGKQVFKEGKTFGDDLLGNTAAALTGGLLGTKDNFTPEMQEEIKESAIGGLAAGLGMAGGTKVLTKSAEVGKEYLDGREKRILAQQLQEQKAETEASVIVAGAREEVVAQQEATFTEAKKRHVEDQVATFTSIEAEIANPETSVSPESIETLRERASDPQEPEAQKKAAVLLGKANKSLERDATEQEKEDVVANVNDIGHIVNSAKNNPNNETLRNELITRINHPDPKVSGKAIEGLKKVDELRAKKEIDDRRAQENLVSEQESARKEQEQAHRDELRSDIDHTTTIATHAAKLTELYAQKKEAETPAQKTKIDIKIQAEKAQLEISKKEQLLSKSETVAAKQELKPTRSVITDSMGGQQIYEAVVAHPAFQKIVQTANNYVDYAKQMIAAFGKKIEAHLKDLWEYARTTLKSERGSFSTTPTADARFKEINKLVNPNPKALAQRDITMDVRELSDGKKWSDMTEPERHKILDQVEALYPEVAQSKEYDIDDLIWEAEGELGGTATQTTIDKLRAAYPKATVSQKKEIAQLGKQLVANLAPQAEQHAANLAEDRYSDESFPKESDYEQPETMSFEDNDVEPVVRKQDLPVDVDYETPAGQQSRIGEKSLKKNQQARNNLESMKHDLTNPQDMFNRLSPSDKRMPKNDQSEREQLSVVDQMRLNDDLNALSDSHYEGQVYDKYAKNETSGDENLSNKESGNIMDFLAPYEDTYKEAGQKMHARKEAPVKDVEGKMLARLARKDIVTVKEYNTELLQLRKQGLTAKQIGVLREAVDRLVEDNDLTREAFDQMKKELLSPISTINHNIQNGNIQSATGALLMVQDEIDARFDEEFELKGTDYGDEMNLKRDLVRPEYSTIEQTVSYFMRKDAPNSQANWAKAGPGSKAWIAQAIKREEALRTKNQALVDDLLTQLDKNKNLDIYKREIHSDYSELGKHNSKPTSSEWHNEAAELYETLTGIADMGYTMEPIINELFAHYGTFSNVTSLPNEETTALYEKLRQMLKTTQEVIDDTVPANEIAASIVKHAEASREIRFGLPYGPQQPSAPKASLAARYEAYKARIRQSAKVEPMIDLFYDAVEKMLGRGHTRGATLFSPDLVAKQMMTLADLNETGPTLSEYRKAAVEIGKALRIDTGERVIITDEDAEVNPSLVREQLTMINNENPGDLPEIHPHDNPREEPVTFAMLNEMYPLNLYDVVKPDGTSFVADKNTLKALRTQPNFDGEATQISKKESSTYNDLYEYEFPRADGKRGWSVWVSGSMLDKGDIPYTKDGNSRVYAVPVKDSRNINNELTLKGKPRTEALYGNQRLEGDLELYTTLIDGSPTSKPIVWIDKINKLYEEARALLDAEGVKTVKQASPDTAVKVKAIYDRVNKGKEMLAEVLAKAKRDVTKIVFAQQHILDEKKFGRDAIAINKRLEGLAAPISPADMFALYEAAAFDMSAYIALQDKMVRDAIDDSVTKAYLQEGSTEILLSRLSVAEREMYQNMVAGKTVEYSDIRTEPEDAGKAWSGARVKASQPIENTFSPDVRAKLDAIRDVEKRLQEHFKKQAYTTELINDFRESANSANKNDKRKAKNIPVKHDEHVRVLNQIVTSREAASIQTIADHVSVVPAEKHSADEASMVTRYSGAQLKIVKSRNTLMQHFFDMVAKMFDADLILVSGDSGFSGRYIPKGLDGRSKIVVNVNAGSIARVFAHELFHHAINKLDAKAYDAFRYAIKEVVHEDKWNEAALKLGRQLEGAEVTKELRAILTNEFNSNPHATAELSKKINRPALPEGKKIVGAETTETVYLDQEARELAENELYSEIFAQAIHQRGFWEALGKHSFEGRDLASRLLISMAQNSAKMIGIITKLSRSHTNNSMVASVVKDWTGVGYTSTVNGAKEQVVGANMNEILIDVLDKAYMSNYLRDGVERAYTPAEEIKDKSKLLVASGTAKLNQAYTTVFPNQSKSYKNVMTAIEKWLDSVINWIAKHKPAGLFADFKTDEEVKTLGNQILHAGERLKQEAYNRIVANHKEAFKSMSDERLANLHQAIIRNPSKFERDKYWNKLTEPQKAALNAMQAFVDKLNAGLIERGLVPADHQFVEYGQAIRLLHKENVVDESIDASLKDAHSQIKGNPSFTQQNNSKKTLKELEQEYGMKPQTLDPMHMFLNYVSGVSQMIALHDTIKDGLAKGLVRHAFSAGMVVVDDPAFSIVNKHEGAKFRILVGDKPLQLNGGEAVFSSAEKANEAMETYQAQIQEQYDEAFADQLVLPGMEELPQATVKEMTEEGRSYMDVSHYEIRRERNISGIDEPPAWESIDTVTAKTREEAQSISNATGPMERGIIRPVFTQAEVKSDSKLYFTPDFAKLMNVILSKDNLRRGEFMGIPGNQVMKIKNGMTMLEMAFSAFHAFTIGQEMISSNAAWEKGRTGKWSLKRFSPTEGVKQAKEIYALMNKVITDNAYAETPAGKDEMKRLLGSSSIDAVDLYHQFFNNGGLFHMDDSLKSGMENWGEVRYTKEGHGFFSGLYHGMADSAHETLEKQRLAHPNSPITAFSKTMLHTAMRGSSAWLMEQGIPKIKFAAFCREYTLKVDQSVAKLGRPLNTEEKAQLARDTMNFIEDRFGEVNWKNMWLNKDYKTVLQFAFRSFTWVAGSWVALAKAGIDIAKLGWFAAKGEKYELTEKGYWGIAALAAHVMTAAAVGAVYGISSMVAGEDEEETDEATPYLTRLLFPRVDPYDNTKRIGIPSYVTEAYKILSHLGVIGGHAEPEKLVVGRFNSLVGKSVDLFKGEDFRGVLIRNPEDSALGQAYDVAKHMLVSPIVFSNIYKNYQAEGFNPKSIPMSLLGFSDAPAFAKRSHAANLAFDLSRREYKGREMTEDEMDLKDDLKKAMQAYVRGDKSKVDELLAEGKVSDRSYKIALTRYPVLDNEPNPQYKDPLSQVLGRLSVKSALKVYEKMTDTEKETHSGEMVKKINNMSLRKDVAPEQQEKYLLKWDELQGA